MAFTTKLNLNNSKFTQTGTLELGGTNNFTGTVNLTGATAVNADGSTLIIDGQAFNNYTGNTTTASNGLTLVGEEVILGGSLTGDTVVNTNGNSLSISTLTGATFANHLAIDNLAIINTPADDANGEVLVWDSATKKVGKTTIAALGGISGATNGLSTSGNDVILGGTLDQNTTIAAAGYSLTVNNALDVSLTNNANMQLSTTGASATLDINGKTNSQVIVKSQSGSLDGDNFTSGVGFNLDYNANIFSVSDNRTTAAGLQYVDDYSSNYTDRSLVDKAYVDAIATGLDAKDASIVATTASDGNIDLTGGTFVSGSTLDGVVVEDGWRVLIKNQTDATENGIYDYSASASGFTRSQDFDGNPAGEVSQGSFSFVVTGDTLASTTWIVTTPDPITVGTTEINFTIAARSFDLVDGTGTTTTIVGANRAVSVELAANSGLDFDSASAAGRLRVASSFAGLGSTLGSGVLDLNVTDTTVTGTEIPVQIDSAGTNVLYIDSDDVSGTLTANNGLTKSGDNIVLGGTLTGITTIASNDSSFFQITGDSGFNTAGSLIFTAGQFLSNHGTSSTTTSSILQTNSVIQLSSCNPSDLTKRAFVLANAGTSQVSMRNIDTVNGCQTIEFDLTNMAVADTINDTGLVYAADYSTSGSTDPRWIPDYAAVTGLTSAAGTTANNGITKVGQNFVLGGSLTGTTTIASDDLNYFQITGDSGFNTTGSLIFSNAQFLSNQGTSGTTTSSISQTNSTIQLSSCNPSDITKRGFILANAGTSQVLMSNIDASGSQTIEFNLTNMLVTDTINDTGLVYAADYSTSGSTDPRWIPDYAAVTASTAGALTTASNGLTKTGNNITLGGSLTGNTTVDISGNGLVFGSGSSVANTVTVENLAITSTPAVGTTSDSVLVRNSSTGIVKTVAGSELGDANNVYDITGITSATLTTAEYVVLVETSGATQTVTLPAAPVDGQAYKIKDKGNALTNSITVSGNGNNIDGAANATINTDYGALELVYSSNAGEWFSLAFIN